MQCPFCYAWIEVDADVCPHCERRLSPDASGPTPAARPSREPLVMDAESAMVQAGRAGWLAVTGLSAALAVALGLIVWLAWPRADAGSGRSVALDRGAGGGRPPATISTLPGYSSSGRGRPGVERSAQPGPLEAVEATYETVLPDDSYSSADTLAWGPDEESYSEELARVRFQQFRLQESHDESQAALRRMYAEAEARHAAEIAELERRASDASRAYEARIAELSAEQERMARGYGQSLTEMEERQDALQARQLREAEDLRKRVAAERTLREAMEAEWERQREALLASQDKLEKDYERQVDLLRRQQRRLESRVDDVESQGDDD